MEKGSVICCRSYSHLPSIWNLFSTSLRPPQPNKVHIFRVFQRITWKTANNLIVRSMSEKGHVAEGVFSMSGEKEAYSASVVGKDKLLTDCGPDQECVLGGVVALGKFDALHIGHRELAIQASKAGAPFLLSFEGMAEVLGWEPRAPIVAKCDRKRVLSSWAPYCGGLVPQEYHVEFSAVRHLSPQQFVERLSRELQISGVVAGENYRFGYKASGDASELVRLCKQYGLEAYIVKPVMDMDAESSNGATQASTKENVSSTRVRVALAVGDMEQVAALLGRKHRLVLAVSPECVLSGNNISLPRSCMLNQPPKDGAFEHCSLYMDDKFLSSCEVFLDSTHVRGEMESVDGFLVDYAQNYEHISIEFG